ncbi:MAG TPA: plastocyanin/azurin family copper-binding protein [Candidatus Thermoplasmatota archaeon]|nr:plastocyanin/azurin family copper-binding protein [Candidatus Thermoplasmatota archaeon]
MRLLLALAALAGVALAGCSGTSAGPQAGTPPMEDGKYVIRLVQGNRFEPAQATVPAGSTVVWVTETGLHDVTEGAPGAKAAWSSDDNGAKLTQGDRYERAFATAGVVHYRCVLHESVGMTGTLTIT